MIRLCFALLLTWPAADAPAAPASQPSSGPADSYVVKPGEFRIEIECPGVFEAEQMAEIAFPGRVTPQVRLVRVAPAGQRVKKGELVFQAEPIELQRAVQAREGALESARTALKLAKQELALLVQTNQELLAQAKLAAERAQEDLDRFVKVDRPQEEKNASQAVRTVANHLAYAKEELRQLKKMYQADDLVEDTEEIVLRRQQDMVDSAAHALGRVQTEQERKTAIDLPRALHALTLARDQKARELAHLQVVLPLTLRKKELEAAKLEQDQAKASDELDKARADLAAANQAAPFDGIVYWGKCAGGRWPAREAVAGKLAGGATVKGEDVLLTIADPSKLVVRASVAEGRLRLLAPAQKGRATAEYCADQPLAVRLERLGDTPEAPGKFEAVFRPLGPLPAGLLPGMSCAVRVEVYSKKDALTVPAAFVAPSIERADQGVVLVRQGGKTVKRTVKLGRCDDGRIEIVEGLKAGETVAKKD